MKKILVAYATLSGTTEEVAQAVGEEIIKAGVAADVLAIAQVKSLDGYDGVVIGAPMIAGWHRGALGFLRRHRAALARVPVAVFVTAMSLTTTAAGAVDGVPICIDEALPKPPADPRKLTWRERYTRGENYARPILGALRPAKPAEIAFFGGRLEYGRLPWWAVLFAMLVVQAPAGNKHNWPFIRNWAAGVPATLELARSRV